MRIRLFLIAIFLALFTINCSLAWLTGSRAESTEAQTPTTTPTSSTTTPSSQSPAPQGTGTTTPREIQAVAAQPTATDQSYVLNELTFEVKKLAAEVRHLQSELAELQAKNQMWANPLAVYDKEIILANGGSFFGKIIYQDDKIIKVETLIGYFILDKEQVVRVVTTIPTKPTEQFVPEEVASDIRKSSETVAPPTYISKTGEPASITEPPSRNANCVLVGNIKERKDRSGNTIFSGEIKNIGSRRADFVKINFIFRKNWSGDTETKTAFVEGSYYTFEGSGVTSNNSLLPGATGTFELIVPKNFGTFIGYSYNIDWEQFK